NDVMTLSQQRMKVGHSSAKKPVMTPGRRDFFSYRDLCIKDASGGAMRGQVMKAKQGMTQPTGWHYHTCEGQFVYILGGWVELGRPFPAPLSRTPGEGLDALAAR